MDCKFGTWFGIFLLLYITRRASGLISPYICGYASISRTIGACGHNRTFPLTVFLRTSLTLDWEDSHVSALAGHSLCFSRRSLALLTMNFS